MAFLTLLTLPDGFILKFQKTLHYYPMHNNYKANTRHLKIFSLLQVIKVIETVSPTITSSFWLANPFHSENDKSIGNVTTTARGHPGTALSTWCSVATVMHREEPTRLFLMSSARCSSQTKLEARVPISPLKPRDCTGVQKHWQSWKKTLSQMTRKMTSKNCAAVIMLIKWGR